jgi:ABC-type polysaccharide/polyol phosphate export permease
MRSYLGWIWSLLNPVAEVAIYSLVFGVLLGIDRTIPDAPNDFTSFPHFLMSGIAVWGFFRMVSSKVLSNFLATVRLRRKLYFPPVAAALSTALSTLVEASILLVVVTLFFGAWGHLSIHAIVLLPAAIFAAMSGLGVGLALSVANSKYRDVSYLYTIGLRLAFYMLPIIWPIQTAAGRFGGTPWLEPVVTSNPFAKMIEFGRSGLLYMQWPTLGDWIYLSIFSTATLFIGWAIFARSSADVAEGL